MKPDYAESVEKAAVAPGLSVWYFRLGFININHEDSYENRVLRLERLGDTEWQVRYLILMIKLLQHRHTWLLQEKKETKLRFLATAYNSGWNKTISHINAHIAKALFLPIIL